MRLPYYIRFVRYGNPKFAKEVLNRLLAGRISCYYANKLLGRSGYDCKIMAADIVIGYRFDRRYYSSPGATRIVTLKIEENVLELVDEIARRMGMNRSDVIRTAIYRFLREAENGKVS